MNTSRVLLSELSNLQNYYERLILVAGLDPSLYILLIRKYVPTIIRETQKFLAGKRLAIVCNDLSFRDLKFMYDHSLNMIKSALSFTSAPQKTCTYINEFYVFLHKLHLAVTYNRDYEVEFPKQVLLESRNENSLPLFFLNYQVIRRIEETGTDINLVEWKRDEYYHKFITKGQDAVCSDHIELALKYFEKALNYRNSAEANTSLSFCYAILGKFSEAKIHCLKAIDIDPDYGPPYNDYGTYLVKEGNVTDALTWFEKAKISINNPSREYPYINSGKIFMANQDYQKALSEFENALMIAPGNQEISEIIDQVNRILH